MSFHSLGAMIKKALSPYVEVLDLEVTSRNWSEERRARAGE